jgi:cell division protein FtsL
MRRAVRVLLVTVMMAAVLFLFVFPVRTLIDQRNQTAQAELRIKGLSAENAKLAQEAARLQTDAEIERIARQHFGVIKPGDHAYILLPPVTPTTTTTTTLAPPTTVSHQG